MPSSIRRAALVASLCDPASMVSATVKPVMSASSAPVSRRSFSLQAVVFGEPTEPGPYVIRIKVPSGLKVMPHRHPEDRVYTVISGVFYIGVGEEFDNEKLEAYPPGAVIVLPGGTPHFHWAKSGPYISQVSAIGPLGVELVNPSNDAPVDG